MANIFEFVLLFSTLIISINAQCNATNSASTLLNQCTGCPSVVITTNSGDMTNYLDSSPVIFSIAPVPSSVANCNSIGKFSYLNNANQWVQNSSAIYSSPSGGACKAKVRTQSCTQATALFGKCIRIDLQGNGGYAIARMVSQVICGSSPTTTPSTTASTTPSTTASTTPSTTASTTPSTTTTTPSEEPTGEPEECPFIDACFVATTSIVLGSRNHMNTSIVSGGTFSAGSDSRFYEDVLVSNPPCPSLTRAVFAAGAEITCPTGIDYPDLCPLELEQLPSNTNVNIPNYSNGNNLAGGFYGNIVIGDGAVVNVGNVDIVAKSITIGNQARLVANNAGDFPFFIATGKIKVGDRVAFQNLLGVLLVSNHTSASGNGDAAILVGSDLNQAIGGGPAPLFLQTTTGLVYLNSRAKIRGGLVADRVFTGDDVVFHCADAPTKKRNIFNRKRF